jgi:hypothetical protein
MLIFRRQDLSLSIVIDQLHLPAYSSTAANLLCDRTSVDVVDFSSLLGGVRQEMVTLATVNYVGNTSMVVGIRVDAEDIKSGASSLQLQLCLQWSLKMKMGIRFAVSWFKTE